jgi:hypothetical protein
MRPRLRRRKGAVAPSWQAPQAPPVLARTGVRFLCMNRLWPQHNQDAHWHGRWRLDGEELGLCEVGAEGA